MTRDLTSTVVISRGFDLTPTLIVGLPVYQLTRYCIIFSCSARMPTSDLEQSHLTSHGNVSFPLELCLHAIDLQYGSFFTVR